MSRTKIAFVLLLAAMLAGCNSSSSTVLVRDTADFNRIFGEVAELTKEPLTRFVMGEPLTTKDLAALEKAKPMIKGLIAFDPTKYRIYVVNAQTLLALGERDSARENFEQALLNAPNPEAASGEDRFIMAECHDDLSEIAYMENKLSIAEDEARAALRLVPPHKDSPASERYLLNLAQIQMAQKNFDAAKETLVEVRKIKPNSQGAKELSAMMEGSAVKPAE